MAKITKEQIKDENFSNWDTAFGWGNHASAGYLMPSDIDTFAELDALVADEDLAKHGDNVSEFVNDAGYLTSFTETDPVFIASPAGSITAGQITNWDTAFGWGDHALAGYLTDAPSDGSEYVRLNGAWSVFSGGGGTPGGSDTNIQFNNGGSFGGSNNLTWDDDQLSITSSDAAKSGLYITNSVGTAGVTIDATLGESWLFGAGGSAFVFRNQTDGEYRMNIPNNASGAWFGADASFVNPGDDIIFANTGIVNSAANIVIENSSAPSGFSIEHTGTTRFSNTFSCGAGGNPSLVSNWNLTGAQDNSSYDSLVFSLQSTTSLFSWSYYSSGGGSNTELMTLDASSGNLNILNGYVGIGTDSPDKALIIEGTGPASTINVWETGAGDAAIAMGYRTGAGGAIQTSYSFFTDTSEDTFNIRHVYKNTSLINIDRLILDKDGNISITDGDLNVNGTFIVGTPVVGDRGDLPTIFGDDTASFSRLFFAAQDNKNLSVLFTPDGTATDVLFQLNNSSDLTNRGRLGVWLFDDTAALGTDMQDAGSATPITTLELGEGSVVTGTTGNLTKIGFWFDKVEAARVDSDGSIHGNSFVTAGGTSSQFVKGDGSLDSTTYLTDSDKATLSKSIGIISPTASEDITMFFTPVAITVSEMRAIVQGSAPSVSWTIKHSTDRSAAGNVVVTAGTTTTSTTTGSDVTSFDDPTIPADSFVWLETTATSGTINDFNVTIIYTED